ncbi:MAG: DUF2975 domain-containing protein [Clostridia bacterium]|nr:DUF2975 domain-containing protein [Clostridia bacterium]
MYKKSIVHHIAKWVIEIMFYAGIVCTVAVPFTIGNLIRYFSYSPQSEAVYRVTLTLAGIFAVYILFNIKKMYKTLLDGSPFVDENVASFRRMALAAAIICVIFVVQAILAFTIGSVTIALIFAIACLFCLTLKDLFKQAINYKVENDLTI